MSRQLSQALVSQRTKELVGAVSATVQGQDVTFDIRSKPYGTLHHIMISPPQNHPVTRQLLQDTLAPAQFVKAAVAFLPREALEPSANILLHRVRHDDIGGMRARVYSYAMLLFYDAARRGSEADTWKATETRPDGSTWYSTVTKRRSVMCMECVYVQGALKGWYIYLYENIKPPAPRKTHKRTRDAQAKAVKEAVAKALEIRAAQGVDEMHRFLQPLEVQLRGLAMNEIVGYVSREGPPSHDDEVMQAVMDASAKAARDCVDAAGPAIKRSRSGEEAAVAAAEAKEVSDSQAQAEDQAEDKADEDGEGKAGEEDGEQPRDQSKAQRVTRAIQTQNVFEWMYAMFRGTHYKVDEFHSLWQQATICPVDEADLLSTFRVVMTLAYKDMDPDLVTQLMEVTGHDAQEFLPTNLTGCVAPRHVYNIHTAVLLKRHYCGATCDEEGSPMTVDQEVLCHLDPVEPNYEIPGPRLPSKSVVLPGSASHLLDGLFRVLLLDVDRVLREQESKERQVTAAVPPDCLAAARIAMRSQHIQLCSWADFGTRVRRHIASVLCGNPRISPANLLSYCLEKCSDFDAHFQQFTPGMGYLSKAVEHFNDRNRDPRHGGQCTLFDHIRIPRGDTAVDKGMDIALQFVRLDTADVARACNNHKNTHVIALQFAVITDSSRYGFDETMEEGYAALLIHGPAGLGKSALMKYIMHLMIPGTADWTGRASDKVGFGSGNRFGSGCEFKDEVEAESIGVDPTRCSKDAILGNMMMGKSGANESLGNTQFTNFKQGKSTGRNAVVTATIGENGMRMDVRTEIAGAFGTIMSANIPVDGLPLTTSTRTHSTHMANDTRDVIGYTPDSAKDAALARSTQDRQAIECYFQWLINHGLLPKPEMRHANDFIRCLYDQLAHENPRADMFANNRATGRVKTHCRSLVVTRAMLLAGLTGVGRDEGTGSLNTEYVLRELRCAMFCPLTYAIFSADLYELAGSRRFIEVVQGLVSLMGVCWNENDQLYERDSSFWEVKDKQRRPEGNTTFKDGEYIVRSGILHANLGHGRDNQRGGGGGGGDNHDSDGGQELRRLLHQLAARVFNKIGDRIPETDVVGVLGALTRPCVRNRAPGFDFERTATESQQMLMPGLRLSRDGIELHQRVGWMFRWDYYTNLVKGMQEPKTSLGKGLRATSDPATGLFDVVEWSGESAYSDALLQRDAKKIKRDLKAAEKKVRDIQDDNAKYDREARFGPRREGGKQPRGLMASQVAAAERHERRVRLREAQDELALVEDALTAVEVHGIPYHAWRDAKGLDRVRVYRVRAVQNWQLVEKDAFAAHLRRYSTLAPASHWICHVSAFQHSYTQVLDTAAALVDYVQQPIAANADRIQFMRQLDRSSVAIREHAHALASFSGDALRAPTVQLMQHLWSELVGDALLCPPMKYVITALDSAPRMAHMALQLFLLHRALHAIRRQWEHIVDVVTSEAVLQGGTIHLFELRQPDTALYTAVSTMAHSVRAVAAGCIAAINHIVAECDIPCTIDYPIVRKLVVRLDCSEKLVTYFMQTELPTPEQIEELIHVIYDTAGVPRDEALPTEAVKSVCVSDVALGDADHASEGMEDDTAPPPSPPPPPPRNTRAALEPVQEGGELDRVLEEEDELRAQGLLESMDVDS